MDYRHRCYCSGLGGFSTRDPVEQVLSDHSLARNDGLMVASFLTSSSDIMESDPHLYRYARNSPNTRLDPSGLLSLPSPVDRLPLPIPVPTVDGKYPASCYKCGMQCGPEVGPSLLLTLMAARAVIRAKSIAQRTAANRTVAIWPLVLTDWDIRGLVNLEVGSGVPWQPCGRTRKGTICDPCVQVFGSMHDVWEINYALWGLFAEGVFMSLDQAKKYAGYYKYATKLLEPNPCKPKLQYTTSLAKWIEVGYEFGKRGPMGVRFSSLVPAGNPRFLKCGICKTSIPMRNFSYNLPIFGHGEGMY